MRDQGGNRDIDKMKNGKELKRLLKPQYRWLLDVKLPRVMQEALHLYGIYEWKGDDNNPVILEWAKEVGKKVGMHYTADSIPWCGLFIAVCVKRAGYDLPDIAVRAKSWLNWGKEIINEKASFGDVLIFDRTGGGHVGFYVGEDDEAYHILGGNQSDQVNIRRMAKNRLKGVRRCEWKIAQPKSVKPMQLASVGTLSTNEA